MSTAESALQLTELTLQLILLRGSDVARGTQNGSSSWSRSLLVLLSSAGGSILSTPNWLFSGDGHHFFQVLPLEREGPLSSSW